MSILYSALSWSQINNSNTAPTTNSIEVEKEEATPTEEEVNELESVPVRSESYKESRTKAKRELSDGDVSTQQVITTKKANSFNYVKTKSATQYTRRTPTVQQQTVMDQTVTYFEQQAPNSFEYHYFKYVAGNYDVSLKEDLLKAEKLKPNNADVQVQMAALNVIEGNDAVAVDYLEKLMNSGRLVNSVVQYGEDLLISVPYKGILITHGFDDFNGAYYQQKQNKVREDVTIISLDYLQSEEYRKKIKAKGVTLPSSEVVDVNYLKSLCELNTSKDINISLTVPKQYFKPIVSSLYVEGLVFKYSNTPVSNFSKNESLWNYEMKKHLINDASDYKGKNLTANYLPMLLQMKAVYEDDGKTEELEKINTAIDQIGAKCNKYDKVQELKGSY